MSQPSSKSGKGVVVRKPASNVYTVLLAISLLAIMLGCLFLYLELREYQTPTASLEPSTAVATVESYDQSHALLNEPALAPSLAAPNGLRAPA